MMQALRNNTKPIFLITIFAFVVGFVFLEGQQLLGGGMGRDSGAVAVVNGSPIAYRAYQQQYEGMRQQMGSNTLSNRMRVQLKQNAYDELVQLTLLQQAAESRGLGTNVEEVLDVLRRQPPSDIRQSPMFMTDGQFDMSKYYQALANPQFLDQIAGLYLQQLPIQKLNDQLSSAAKTPIGEALSTLDARVDRATISYISVAPSLFGPDPTSFSQDEVAEYYRANASEYTPENTAVITYAYLPRRPSAIDSLEITDVLQSIYFEIQAGESIDELIDIHSESSANMRGGPSGTFIGAGSQSMTPELAAVLDTLEVGQYSGPFHDTYGFHIVSLDSTRTTDAGETTYRIKDLLMRVSVSGTTERDLETYMMGFYADVRKRGGNISAVTDTSTTVQSYTSPPIDLSRQRPFVDANIPAFSELLTFCREADPGDLDTIIEGPGGYYLWHLDERGPGKAPPLAEVETLVRQDMVADRGAERAHALAGEIARRAHEGETLEAIADSDSLLHVEVSRPFGRAMSIAGIGKEPEIMGAAFAIPIGQVGGPFEASNGVLHVIRVDERTGGAAATAGAEGLAPETIADAVSEVQRMKIEMILTSYLESLRKEAKVKDLRPIKTGTI